MKNNVKTGIIIGAIVLILCIVAFKWDFKEEMIDNKPSYLITNDSLKFQNEYEKYNDTKNKVNVSIKSYNTVKYSSYDEIYEILNSDDGNYTILLASAESEESREFAPILVDAALEFNKEIYYLDIYNDMDNKKLNKKGKIEIVKEGSNNYKKLVKKLYDYLPSYEGLKDDTIKRVYLPTLVVIDNGKINLLNYKGIKNEDRISISKKLSEYWINK